MPNTMPNPAINGQKAIPNGEAVTSSGKTHHWAGVLDSALDAVGHTPLIRLDRIARQDGFTCNLCKHPLCSAIVHELIVVGKTEFFSVGGSVKDRIAKVRRNWHEDEIRNSQSANGRACREGRRVDSRQKCRDRADEWQHRWVIMQQWALIRLG